MTTNNGVNTGLSGSTGSGSFVGSTSASLTTPILGTPTSGNLSNCTALPLTTGISGILPVANGGTNASTAAAAATSLLSSLTIAVPSGTLSGVTGDGTAYTLAYNTATTNIGSNYNTGTYTYTCPTTGNYEVILNAQVKNLAADNTTCVMGILLNGVLTYFFDISNPYNLSGGNGVLIGRTLKIACTATNTLAGQITIAGHATKNIDIGTAGSQFSVQFLG